MDQFLTVSEYNNGKSFVVRGDTSQHKNKFLCMNGKFKSSLIGGPGWLFPNRNLGTLTMYIAEAVEDDNNPLVMSTTVSFNNKSNYPSYIPPPLNINNSIEKEVFNNRKEYRWYIPPPEIKKCNGKCNVIIFLFLVSIFVFIIFSKNILKLNDNIEFYVNNTRSLYTKFNFDDFNMKERYDKLNDNIEFYVNNTMSMYRNFNFDDLKMKMVERMSFISWKRNKVC
jgi:hypothetical protein